MSSLAAYEFNRLATAGNRPATPQTAVSIDRKRAELNGSGFSLNQWGTPADEKEAPAPLHSNYVAVDRKQDELRGQGNIVGADVVSSNAFASHSQLLEPEKNFEVDPPPHWAEGKIVHIKEPRPESPINGSPKVFRKTTAPLPSLKSDLASSCRSA